MKVITLTNNKECVITIPKPDGIWFNVKYGKRASLSCGEKVTISEWTTISNKSVLETLEFMKIKDIKLLRAVINLRWSKRTEKIIDIIDQHITNRRG